MACTINKKDSIRLRDIDGNPNLIARWRKTRKGQKQVADGKKIGGEGVNGSSYYEIRLGSDGVLYCSCPDYHFRGHASNHQNPGTNYLCKHVQAYLSHADEMLEEGVDMDSECIIYNEPVTRAAIYNFAPAIVAGDKVARVVADKNVAVA